MEIKLLAWLSIGIPIGIFALIIWIFWRKLFKKPALAPETKTETEKEEKKEPVVTPKSKSYATTVLFLLLLILVTVMIVHRIDTGRWGFVKSTEIQAKFRPLAGAFEMPAAAIQDIDGSWRVPVLANKLIVDSTLRVKKGQGIIITATGQVNGCKNRYDAAYGWIGPEGRKWSWNRNRKRPLGQDAPFMTLCAKIGESGKWFKVGKEKTFTVLRGGKLFFTVNDDFYDEFGKFRPDWIKDNEGGFVVKVKIG